MLAVVHLDSVGGMDERVGLAAREGPSLQQRDGEAALRQLTGGGETGQARPDYRDPAAYAARGLKACNHSFPISVSFSRSEKLTRSENTSYRRSSMRRRISK